MFLAFNMCLDRIIITNMTLHIYRCYRFLPEAFHSSLFSCSSVLFSSVIISLEEERTGLYASRACVCLSCMRYILSFSLPLCVGGQLRIVIVVLCGLLL